MSPSTASVRGWRRVWRPDQPAFWMALLFNGVSSALVLWDRYADLDGAAQTALLLLALANSLLGLWWLKRLWQTGATPNAAD